MTNLMIPLNSFLNKECRENKLTSKIANFKTFNEKLSFNFEENQHKINTKKNTENINKLIEFPKLFNDNISNKNKDFLEKDITNTTINKDIRVINSPKKKIQGAFKKTHSIYPSSGEKIKYIRKNKRGFTSFDSDKKSFLTKFNKVFDIQRNSVFQGNVLFLQAKEVEARRSDVNNYAKELIKEISSMMNLKKEVISCVRENSLMNKKKFNSKKVLNRLVQDKMCKSFNDKKENNLQIQQLGELNNNVFTFTEKANNSLSQSKKLMYSSLKKKQMSKKKSLLQSEPKYKLIINHERLARRIWDFIIFILILYTIFVTPIYLAFSFNHNDYVESNIMCIIEIVLEIFFVFEMIFNFFTTFRDKEENLVKDNTEIYVNYLISWFIIDLFSAFPVDLISHFYTHINSYKFVNGYLFQFIRWIKLLRIAKIFKTQTTGRYINKIVLDQNYTLNRVFKSIFLFFLLTHIASCFFIMIGSMSICDNTWIKSLNLEGYFEIYVASLYYSHVTIFSIGYGDIVPVNIIEKSYVLLFMFVGNMLFSYTISSLSNVFSEKNNKYTEYRNRLNIFESINQEYELSQELQQAIKSTINNDYQRNEIEKFEFLESLPSNVRNDLCLLMYEKNIEQHKFFKNQPQNFILSVLPLFKYQRVNKGDVLINIGQFIDEMYFVVEGHLGLNLGPDCDYYEISHINKGEHYGDVLMQLNEQSPYELKCKSNSADIFILKKTDFLNIKISFHSCIFDILEQSFDYLELIDKRKQLLVEFLRFYKNSKEVKKQMKKLNSYLLDQQFDDYFINDIVWEDANDFIVRHRFEEIKILLNSLDKTLMKKSLNNITNATNIKCNYEKKETKIKMKDNILTRNRISMLDSKAGMSRVSLPNLRFHRYSMIGITNYPTAINKTNYQNPFLLKNSLRNSVNNNLCRIRNSTTNKLINPNKNGIGEYSTNLMTIVKHSLNSEILNTSKNNQNSFDFSRNTSADHNRNFNEFLTNFSRNIHTSSEMIQREKRLNERSANIFGSRRMSINISSSHKPYFPFRNSILNLNSQEKNTKEFSKLMRINENLKIEQIKDIHLLGKEKDEQNCYFRNDKYKCFLKIVKNESIFYESKKNFIFLDKCNSIKIKDTNKNINDEINDSFCRRIEDSNFIKDIKLLNNKSLIIEKDIKCTNLNDNDFFEIIHIRTLNKIDKIKERFIELFLTNSVQPIISNK